MTHNARRTPHDGHSTITIVHHEPMAQVVKKQINKKTLKTSDLDPSDKRSGSAHAYLNTINT